MNAMEAVSADSEGAPALDRPGSSPRAGAVTEPPEGARGGHTWADPARGCLQPREGKEGAAARRIPPAVGQPVCSKNKKLIGAIPICVCPGTQKYWIRVP